MCQTNIWVQMAYDLSSSSLFRQQAYFSGEWRSARDGATFGVIDPATGNVIGRCASLTESDVAEAIATAEMAFAMWSSQTAAYRANILKKWHVLILEHKEELARIMTTEQGKPIREARIEIDISAAYVEWFAEEGRRVYGDVIPSPVGGRQTVVTKQPVGVCAAITPWNFPASMFTRKLAPALAAGCAMMVRPSDRTPFVALAFAALGEQAGLPSGVFSVLTGSSRTIVKAIMESSAVRKISFTGSTEVGKILIKQSADTVKRMSMELGGNAPILIFDDCDLDAAINGLMALKFRNGGQTCVCANRILVQNSIREEFIARFAERTKALKVGNGHDEETEMGPLITRDAALGMQSIVESAVKSGARVVIGGTIGEGEACAFFAPTILTDVTPDMAVAREEIFGPVAPVLGFDTENEAVAIANDTEYGLASYVYTRDLGRAWRVSDALQYGMVGINEVAISNEVAPFGGIKESGFGREGSKYGIEEYLDIKYRCFGGLGQPS